MFRDQQFSNPPAIHPRLRWLNVVLALALLSVLCPPAQAGSASATLRVTVRVVSSCSVSATSLQSIGTTAQGRFNCPSSNPSILSNSPASGAAANYTVTEVPDSGGSVKLVTINF